jgi:hypothetical protein
MNLKCIRLDMSHLEAALAIRVNNPVDVDNRPIQNPEHARHALENQYLVSDNDYYRAYGMVDDDGKLWSYGLQKMLFSQRAWVLVLVISDQTATSGRTMNGLGVVLDAMIDYAEEHGYYRYYTVTPAARGHTHDKAWTRISQRKGDRYMVVPEETLPARSMSAFSHYWDDVLAGMMFDEVTLLRMCILKPEYRSL